MLLVEHKQANGEEDDEELVHPERGPEDVEPERGHVEAQRALAPDPDEGEAQEDRRLREDRRADPVDQQVMRRAHRQPAQPESARAQGKHDRDHQRDHRPGLDGDLPARLALVEVRVAEAHDEGGVEEERREHTEIEQADQRLGRQVPVGHQRNRHHQEAQRQLQPVIGDDVPVVALAPLEAELFHDAHQVQKLRS